MREGCEDGGKRIEIWFAKAEKDLLGWGGFGAEEIKVGGLVKDLIAREEEPLRVAEGMADGKFGKVGWEFFVP